MMNDIEVTSLLNIIKNTASKQKCDTSQKEDNFLLDFIDIDEFLDILYSLFKSNGHICDNEECKQDKSNKFIFTQEYPDFRVNDEKTISVGIDKRTVANLSNNAQPFQGTSNYKPMYLGEEKDEHSGLINIYLQMSYDNMIEFVCWGPTVTSSRKLASLLEKLMIKYYWVMRKYVPVIIYIERGNTIVSSQYGDSRYIGVPLKYFIRTNERFVVKESELKSINIDLNIIKNN